jgi:hypothetical protein
LSRKSRPDIASRSLRAKQQQIGANTTIHADTAHPSTILYFIIEMWWYPGQDPHHEDLTAQTSAPLAFSHRPARHVLVDVTNHQSTQYVCYTSTGAQMVELWWRA